MKILCQAMVARFYEKGTRKSYSWVWKTKADWLDISYSTFLRNRKPKVDLSLIPQDLFAAPVIEALKKYEAE